MKTRSILKQTVNCPLIPPDPGASLTARRLYCAFHKHANSNGSKATFKIVFIAAVNHNYDQKQRTLKQRKTKRIEIHKSQTMTFWTREVEFCFPGGVRHDPQRFMGKTVAVPHFNSDTVDCASRKRSESNPGIKTPKHSCLFRKSLRKRAISRIFKIS